MGEESSLHPRLCLFRVGGKGIWGERPFVLLCSLHWSARCRTQFPRESKHHCYQGLWPLGANHAISHHCKVWAFQQRECCTSRWTKQVFWVSELGAEVLARWEPCPEDCEFLCLSLSNSLPDNPFRLRQPVSPNTSPCTFCFQLSTGTFFSLFPYNKLHNECSSC